MLINLWTLGQAPAVFFQMRMMRHSPLGQRHGLRFVRPAIAQQSHKYRIAFMPQGSLGQHCETMQRCLSFKRSSPGFVPQGEPPWPLWQLTFHPGELQQVKKAKIAVPLPGRMLVLDFLYTCWGVGENLRSTKLTNWAVRGSTGLVIHSHPDWNREKYCSSSLPWLLVQYMI